MQFMLCPWLISDSSFSININASCQATDERYKLSTEYEKLAHIVVDVEEWSALGNISIEDFSVKGQADYYVDQSGCFKFGYLCVENGKVPLELCEITSHSTAPFGAGVRALGSGNQQTVRFTGTGFGNGLLGKVLVPNADDGGASDLTIFSALNSYIKSWNNTEIEVLISSNFGGDGGPPMGSGDWKIFPAQLLGCVERVDIDYALFNARHTTEDKMISLAKNKAKVPSGAVEWYIHTPSLPAGITLAQIEPVARQAFCDWEGASSIEFKYLGPTNVISGNDERITISFGVPGNASAAAVTSIDFNSGLCKSDLFFTGRMTDNNIMFNSGLTWYIGLGTSPGTSQYDFYSVLMHEIGHAIGLKHAMDTDPSNGTLDNRLMYFSLKPSQIKRNIDARSLRGADDLADRTAISLNANLPDCFGKDDYAFNRITDGCASSTKTITELSTVNLLNNLIYCGDDLLLTSSQNLECDIRIYDILGRSLDFRSLIIYNGQASVPTNALSGGYYLIHVLSNGQQKSFPFFVK